MRNNLNQYNMKKGLTILAYLWLISAFGFTLSSCSKDDDPKPKPVVLTKEQGWSKEIYNNMKEIYLWNDALPATFDPTKYATPEDALDYLIGLKIDPATNSAIDRYSFLDKIGNLSGEINGGTASGDYGFMIMADVNSSKQVSFFVTYAYANSPAGKAGVQRSYEIVAINGSSDVHPSVTTEGKLDSKSTGYITVVNALFNSQSAKFTFKRPDGSQFDAALTAGSFTINSVLFDKVIEVGSKKVGYVVFNQFLGEPAVAELNAVISKFEAAGVNSVVVDLRYNGGGSVATCEKFCNLLAPSTANGKVMYKYKMNSLLQAQYNPASLISNFEKTNSFQPESLYFIVSGSTASASELLINNLRPYFAGKLFLIGSTTYGKPCGFWATPIGYTENQTTTKEGYDLYAVSFESINSNNEGGYYAGMTPGSTQYPGVKAYDTPKVGWGDETDERLGQALYHIANGTFKATTKSTRTMRENVIDRQFKGMIDFRKHLK